MSNYSKINVTGSERHELHDKLGLTGAEVSINTLPAGAGVPFVHAHKQNEEIYGIMCMQTSETIVLDDTLKIECLHVKKMDMNSNEEKEIVFGNAINGGGKQQIFYTEKYYEKLWVTAIPFMNVQNYQEQVKNNKKMIISPINPSNSSMELLQKELAGKENVEKCFEEYVKKNGNFQYLLDWVQKHQFSPDKYSKPEIEASYTDLIKFIYEREVKNHIVKQI